MIGNEPIPEKPKPRYQGTRTCRWCRAEYRPGNWFRGYDANAGTTLPFEFVRTSQVPDHACPVCLRKEE